MSWTDERIEKLKQLWADGLSASQIARTLGEVTRNAVIGKVHRLGLAGRATTHRAERPRAAVPARIAPPRVAPIKAEPVAEEPLEPMPENAVSVLDLSNAVCKWPIGDPADSAFRFCGRKSKPGSPYCEAHARMAYQPAQTRRDRDRDILRRKLNFG